MRIWTTLFIIYCIKHIYIGLRKSSHVHILPHTSNPQAVLNIFQKLLADFLSPISVVASQLRRYYSHLLYVQHFHCELNGSSFICFACPLCNNFAHISPPTDLLCLKCTHVHVCVCICVCS